jgi:hypothetical protein
VEAVVTRAFRLLLVLPVAAAQFILVALFLTLLCVLAAAWSAALTVRAAIRGPLTPVGYARAGITAIEQALAEEAQP